MATHIPNFLVSTESAEEVQNMKADLAAEFRPQSALEHSYLDEMALARVRMLRYAEFEAALIDQALEEKRAELGPLASDAKVYAAAIRDLIDKHPHRIVLVCDRGRELAARLATCVDVDGIQFLDAELGGSGLLVQTRQPDAFYARLPGLAVEDGLAIREVYSEDDNLEAVFKYLVNQ